MSVRRISSGGKWEPIVGYSRAVQAGDFVLVSGCTAMRDGELVHVGDMHGQTLQAIRNIGAVLEQFGATLADVVRTRVFVTDMDRWEEAGRAHGEVFGEVLPATAVLGISRLADPRMLVEVEADAYLPGPGAR